jgi:polyisoprenoid-binding protein YceI
MKHFILIVSLLTLAMIAGQQPLIAQSKQHEKTYSVDTEQSKLDWTCGNHNGYIQIKEGTLLMRGGIIVGGNFKIAMDSIVNHDIDYALMRETLINLLRSDHYFDTEKYPVATFNIKKVNIIEGNNYCILGDLTIKDQSHPLTFHAEISSESDHLIAKSEKFFIDRTKWGITTSSINYVKDKDSFTFADEIYFVINLSASQQ